jgi:hypothetical protein
MVRTCGKRAKSVFPRTQGAMCQAPVRDKLHGVANPSEEVRNDAAVSFQDSFCAPGEPERSYGPW